MKEILALLQETEENQTLCDILSAEYKVLRHVEESTVLLALNGPREHIAAILFDAPLLSEEGFSLPQLMAEDKRFVAIPLVAVGPDGDTALLSACIRAGASEYFAPPFIPELILLRFNNAVRGKDSATFHEIERMLKELPSNIYLKDAEGKYIFATHYWHHLHQGDDPNWTIRGKTDVEIRKDKKNALLAMESDKRLLATGEGTSYIIEENDDGIREFLQLIKRPTYDENGNINGIIALINDVTEHQLLKLELEKRSKTDPLTGLLNKSATEELITLILSNYRKEGGAGALLMIDVDKFKTVNDTFGHVTGDRVLAAIGNLIHRSFKGMDVGGRIGGDEFMVFLRDIDEPEAVCHLAKLIGDRAAHTFDGELLSSYVSLSIGIALFPRHGRTFEDLYNAADRALYYVKEHGRGAYRVYDGESLT